MESAEPSREVALPGTGEIVDLSDVPAVASALQALRDYESVIRDAKTMLTSAIVDYATELGLRSIELPDGSIAQISQPFENVYDPEVLERGFRNAGMPEERIRDIIEETVSYRVKVNEAKKAARANPAYAQALEESRTEAMKVQYVTIKKRV